MRVDHYCTLVSEEHDENTDKGYQGNRGESQAVTSRLVDLSVLLGEATLLNLEAFVTPTGTCRHPRSQWRESHESSDMAIAFYMAASKQIPPLAIQMKERIIKSGYKTGNGDYVSVAFFALLKSWVWLLNIALIGQMLIFRIPWRYNEEKKAVESSSNSSCDWMNFIHLLWYSSPWVKRLVSKEKLKERVRHYLSREPNAQFLFDLYDRGIDRICS